jgi:hypothetical protein
MNRPGMSGTEKDQERLEPKKDQESLELEKTRSVWNRKRPGESETEKDQESST